MELSQLRTLIHVAELGSLSKAADRLHIAQPALSRQVRMLEEELGFALFLRHGRGMVLSEQGKEVLTHAMRVMAEIDEIRATATPANAPLT
ncbi:LysR family transcriptional regulator, partial [Mesorhizobium sp. M7A.F.Ca.CA.001.11.2.1]